MEYKMFDTAIKKSLDEKKGGDRSYNCVNNLLVKDLILIYPQK
ncbi:MAG: hypothetical protein IEMM0008_0582 [bacterium]|nr:MAG: hypothetical protein IEMM0008_0582 [bacterium]